MAFKIALNPSYTVTVKVELPNDRDGFDKSEFKAKFKRCTVAELDDLREKPMDEALKSVLVGYSNLLDEDNKEVEFNDDNLNALLAIPQARIALNEAFWLSIFKAKEKN
jgi:hypothetical protein